MKIEFKNITSNTNLPDGTEWKVTTKKREYTILISYHYNMDWGCEKRISVYPLNTPLSLYNWADKNLP